ncbi:uncharacterized protein Z520_10076 [Fonsecaea multimorphosa CBS 102226]|uniref:Uncharacterized protein n=1 Tax=Fonsecaea multimorphosa CBS 102226 TaxID=1442371 RepID=A0A0D2GWR1_9EURO|nr:uncharacterized protein Z520_10076 [Fonsecaea multimorphosa CBS 102226]KIX94050.1 hypothetical protein Z520_10076 [Fonsecaea multimorphosa CBS 102226]OAL19404.1 hypothetical protein AYO22_09566 [Fonsecaea multimorphosa]
MVNKYTLVIKNLTGAPQNYSFFSANPVISGSATGPIWSNVLKAANNTPDGGTATLEVWHNYYAVCGSFDGDPATGAKVSIGKSVGITLGTETALGSTIALTVVDGSACDLGPPTDPGNGKIGNFQLTTGGKFTFQDAKNNNLLVGIGTSKDGNVASALGTFIPMPSSTYQIQPSVIYYVCCGSKFEVGAAVKVEQMGKTLSVNFDLRKTNSVTVNHDAHQNFVFA